MNPDVSAVGHQQLRLQSPGLPLAVYYEVAAHLRQIVGVETHLHCQSATEFDYGQSQVGGLSIRYPIDLDPENQQAIANILSYYSDRFGPWIQSH